ncbi:hypothetical protein SBA4_4430017 [Candidatus Sulfopaludibacter sp. SbA4]|nr:hypothetical protein SBA4_4430017 [Candidatus Sulfopaludibacter sp. SbA4]
MLGNGDGTFQPEVSLSVGTATTSVVAADFNGDGKMDAAIAASFNPTTSDYLAVLTNVTASGGAPVPAPASDSPGSGFNPGQVFTFTFTDSGGWQNLSVVDVLINSALDGRHACYVAFVPSGANSGSVFLVDDAGDAGGPYQGLVLPGSGSVSNSQCTISGTGSSASGSGETLTLTLAITFSASFGGNQVVYTSAGGKTAANSGWQALGTWGVPYQHGGSITVSSLFPASAAAPSGTAQTFTFDLVDSKGATDIGVVNVLINNFIDGRQACYLAYVQSSNTWLLVDDAGDAGGPFAGSMVLDGNATDIQNSQCIIDGSGSSASTATGIGNTLTLELNIIFKSGFTGNHVIWAAGRDTAGANNTGWQAMGTTSVQ